MSMRTMSTSTRAKLATYATPCPQRLTVSPRGPVAFLGAFTGASASGGQHDSHNSKQLSTQDVDRLLRKSNSMRRRSQRLLKQQQQQNFTPDHPTMDLIAHRFAQGSRPGKRNDPFKLGLVIEGGGMRGVISAAMLMELKKLGLDTTVDCIYGASAGAINATYYLAGQGDGLNIYTDDLATSDFVDKHGLKKGRPVMDLDYVFNHVMQNVKPVNWEAVLSSPIELKVVASSLDTMKPVLLEKFTCHRDLMECLRASATVPRLVGPPRLVRGERLVDAAVFEPVPTESALKDGCTHVLVLNTRNTHVANGWRARVKRQVVKAIIHSWLSSPPYLTPPEYGFFETSKRLGKYHKTEDIVASAVNRCPHEVKSEIGGYVLPLFPNDTHGLHPLCTEVDRLQRGMEEGASVIQQTFSHVVHPSTDNPPSDYPPTFAFA